MSRISIFLFVLCLSKNINAQSDFNTHIGAHLSTSGVSSIGYPFSADSGLYGHFLPEFVNENITVELIVSPNPFNRAFSVSCVNRKIFSIELKEELGRTVYISEPQDLYQPNIPAGKYYLLATTSSGQTIKTIIRIE